jgi:molybdenum cofactor cytidylyltransferase
MGGANKLLAPVDGRPMVRRVVDEVLASRARPLVIVTGYEADLVRAAVVGRPVEFAHNPDFGAGMSTSIRVGIEALGDRVDGALVCLADMPWVAASVLGTLIDAFADARGEAICVPHHQGRRGNPVLWPAGRFADLLTLRGDVGARALLEAGSPGLHAVPVSDDGVLRDVDTPEALGPGVRVQ